MEISIKDKTVPIDAIKVADGVKVTPKLVVMDPKAIAFGDNFQRVKAEAINADIHYVINKSNVRSSELRDDDIKGLETFVKDASGNEKVKVKNASISAYASPDGELDFNEDLADRRAAYLLLGRSNTK